MQPENKLGSPLPQRIVILRALQLGDMLCTVPAFRALRSALPDATITLMGLPWARGFVERFNFYLDDFIEFPGFPGLPEQPPQVDLFPDFLHEIQRLDFDLALQMQGSGSITNLLVELFGARMNAGYYLPGQYAPGEDLFMVYPEDLPEIHRHLKLMEFLGIPSQGDTVDFPLYREDWAELLTIEKTYALVPGEYVCVHPGARAQNRRWPIERFAEVGDGLADRGLKVVLTGSATEIYLTAAVAAQMKMPAIDLAGDTSLGGVAALLSKARLLVCNDTGVSHLAAALLTPSVVLFSASDPQRWAPLNRGLHRVVENAREATPEKILSEADGLLNKERLYAF